MTINGRKLDDDNSDEVNAAFKKASENELNGILQSSTKDFDCGHVLAHADTQDGLLAYLEMEAENQYGGSKILKEEELDEKIHTPYNEKEWPTLVALTSHSSRLGSTNWLH